MTCRTDPSKLPRPGASPASEPVRCVLTVNGGSSSIKFALYRADSPTTRLLSGKIERIGLPKPTLTIHDGASKTAPRVIRAPNHRAAAEFLIGWLDHHVGFANVAGVGHRVVHGGLKLSEAQRITPQLVAELHRISPYDPEHMPSGIQLMEVFHQRHPRLPQVACFDTAFHRDMPRVAKLLAIPRRFDAKGVQRFGFHGLSYTFLMEELERVAGPKAARGRLILAHLGNGASLAAVRNGKSIDTSMGFTPAAGIPMSTRSGDLDPGLVWYLARTEQMTGKQFHEMVHHQSGLLGRVRNQPRHARPARAGSQRRSRRRGRRAVLLPGEEMDWRFCRGARRVGHARLRRRDWGKRLPGPRADLRRPPIPGPPAGRQEKQGRRAGHFHPGQPRHGAGHPHG